MSSLKVFITGVTGYIGGDILSVLLTRYPQYSYTALVRTEGKGNIIEEKYPSIKIVYGSLEDTELLERESAKADIILHNADAADHVGAAKAITTGALASSREKPTYLIHTSGAGILSYQDTKTQTYGEENPKVYDDWDGIDEITNFPDDAFHRDVDKIVLEAGTRDPKKLKVAIVSPTTVYGPGRGPISQRSRQVYELARITIERKKAPIIGSGKAIGTNIHIQDLTEAFVLLFEAAANGDQKNEDLWGPEAYYFVENGEHSWGETAKEIARIAADRGYIPEASTETITFEEAKTWNEFETASWGINVRARGYRSRHLLGWKPTQPSLKDELPVIVEGEWAILQGEK